MTTLRFFIAAILLSTALVYAQGIMPGEPDPNSAPGHRAEGNEETLLDDRNPCPQGTRRFPKMKCGTGKEGPNCDAYKPVLECRKKEQVLKCQKPKIPVPIYKCE